MDLLAFSLAVAATAVGVLILTYLVINKPAPEIATTKSSSAPRATGPTATPPPALTVRLGGDRATAVWRLESALDDQRISIDVFSQRSVTDGTPTDWRHDLMDTPLSLAPGQTAELPAVCGGTRHEAAVGWFVGLSPERNRDSLYLSVPTRDR